jgi:hypothetical protein
MAGSAIGRAINERSDGVTVSKPPCTRSRTPSARPASAKAEEDLVRERKPYLLDIVRGFNPWFLDRDWGHAIIYAWMLPVLSTGRRRRSTTPVVETARVLGGLLNGADPCLQHLESSLLLGRRVGAYQPGNSLDQRRVRLPARPLTRFQIVAAECPRQTAECLRLSFDEWRNRRQSLKSRSQCILVASC